MQRAFYLLAFGPSRHCAWVVVQRPLRCWLGSREKPFGGPARGSLEASGGCSGAAWGLFWASWGLLGLLGGLLRPPGGLLGACWRSRGPSKGGGLDMSIRVPPLRPLLGPSWGPLGQYWSHIEASEAHQKRTGEKGQVIERP